MKNFIRFLFRINFLKLLSKIGGLARKSYPYKTLVSWSKVTIFPGSEGNSIYDILSFIWLEWKTDALNSRANAISFSFFISIFPSLIVLFTLIAYTPLYSNFNDLIKVTVHDLMPGSAEQVVLKTIKDITTIKRSSLLSVGFVLAIYFSSNGMLAMMKGFEKANHTTFHDHGALQKRWIAIKLTFLLGVLLLASVILGIMGSSIVEYISDFIKLKKFEKIGLTLIRWLVMVSLLYGGISVIYRLGVPLKKKLPLVNPGATLATILSIIISLLFSYYVDNFGSYNKLYGSIGTLIVFLLWLQLNVFNMLLGFELNAAIAVNRDLKTFNSHIKDTE